MNRIVNLTQHNASQEQIAEGVFDLQDSIELKALLTIEVLPTPDDLFHRACSIVQLALDQDVEYAMIGGAPYLMSTLEAELKNVGIQPLYAFTQRVVTEQDAVKTATFKHEGFVSA